jgi:SH3 domain-containing YSC84-like protein 1
VSSKTIALFSLCLAFGGAAAACSRSTPPPSAPAPGAEAEQRIVDASAEAIRRLRVDAKFATLNDHLKDAKGVLVFPRLIRASFILGGEGGTGVLTARGPDGKFGAPAFYAIGSGGIGPQIGYREATVVLLLMTDRAVSSVLHSGLTLGANASVAAGTDTGEGRASTATRDVIAFVDVGGMFAGASVDGAVVEPRQKLNDAYYRTSANPWDIVLNRRYDHPGARVLRDSLTSDVAAPTSPTAVPSAAQSAGTTAAPPLP